MAEISKITMPSGNTYDIKDATAREAISKLQNIENVLSTDAASTPSGVTWNNNGITITGTLAASATTQGKIYLVPNGSNTDKNTFKEYLTIKTTSNTYAWEMIGTTETDLSNLGALAYKDSASGSTTPSGTVSQPTFSGNQLNSTGNFTPSGTVSFTNTNKTAAVSSTTGATTYTPDGSVSAPSISVAAAGATTNISTVSSIGTLPSLVMTVSSENLTFSWDAGTLPSITPVTVKTGDATYEASTPTFTGTGVRLVTDNISVPSAAIFSGTQGSISVSGTPSGTVSQPSFSGNSATVTVS